MNKQNIYFIILVSVFGLLSLLILYKFIVVLVLAYIFAMITKPIQEKIDNFFSKVILFRRFSNPLASIITIILFIIVVVTPITIILSKVVVDTQSVYESVVNNKVNLNFIGDKVTAFSNNLLPSLNFNINKVAESISSFFVNNIGNLFSGTVDIVLKSFLFLFAMFYFLKDGKQFGQLYSLFSPLKKENDDKIFKSIKQSIHSIMVGSLVIALAQGLFTGFGLWVFGVPNPFFFGTIAGFLALIPSLGPAFVWFPAAIYLFFTKPDSFFWLYQILWGLTAISLIDNILGPKVINKGIKIHPLFILLSIIGGISVFGPEGFIFGPLILSIFVAIIRVWNEDKVV